MTIEVSIPLDPDYAYFTEDECPNIAAFLAGQRYEDPFELLNEFWEAFKGVAEDYLDDVHLVEEVLRKFKAQGGTATSSQAAYIS